MQKEIEFWYEFASTYSYPAAMRAEEIAARYEVKIKWQPFLLGPIFRELGWSTSPFNLQPAKGAYMWRDMARICDTLGLPFVRADAFPQNGLLAARVAMVLPDAGLRAVFSRAVYAAQFGQGADISDSATIATCIERLGLKPRETIVSSGEREAKNALRYQTERAQAHGIFGAPTWRTSDGEIFWGNDRLEDALRWAQALTA